MFYPVLRTTNDPSKTSILKKKTRQPPLKTLFILSFCFLSMRTRDEFGTQPSYLSSVQTYLNPRFWSPPCVEWRTPRKTLLLQVVPRDGCYTTEDFVSLPSCVKIRLSPGRNLWEEGKGGTRVNRRYSVPLIDYSESLLLLSILDTIPKWNPIQSLGFRPRHPTCKVQTLI